MKFFTGISFLDVEYPDEMLISNNNTAFEMHIFTWYVPNISLIPEHATCWVCNAMSVFYSTGVAHAAQL